MPKDISTKQKIFNAAVDLFSAQNYNCCTIRDIAAAVGIKNASIYNHYKSKEDILLDIFEYYKINFNKYRTPLDTVIRAMDTEPLQKVIPMLFYTFGTEEEYTLMMKISRIVMDMKLENADAQKLFQTAFFDEPMAYIESAFSALIAAGKVKPFPYEPFAFQLVSFSHMLFVLASLDESKRKEVSKRAREGIDMFARGILNASLLTE